MISWREGEGKCVRFWLGGGRKNVAPSSRVCGLSRRQSLSWESVRNVLEISTQPTQSRFPLSIPLQCPLHHTLTKYIDEDGHKLDFESDGGKSLEVNEFCRKIPVSDKEMLRRLLWIGGRWLSRRSNVQR